MPLKPLDVSGRRMSVSNSAFSQDSWHSAEMKGWWEMMSKPRRGVSVESSNYLLSYQNNTLLSKTLSTAVSDLRILDIFPLMLLTSFLKSTRS